MNDLVQCPYCEGEVSPTAKKCRHCGEWLQELEGYCRSCDVPIRGQWARAGECADCQSEHTSAAVAEPVDAWLKSRHEMSGEGCAIQGMGCLAGMFLLSIPIVGWVAAPVIIVATLAAGKRKHTKWSCSACGNPVADGEVRTCPSCGAHLEAYTFRDEWNNLLKGFRGQS